MPAEQSVMIPVPEGQMPASLLMPAGDRPRPAVLLLMEAFGLTPHIREIGSRIANQGYVVLVPDLYYRELPNNKFGYSEVDRAMAAMARLDLNAVEQDLLAALRYLASQPNVISSKIGVTGFCLGGGLSFLAACRFSRQIAAAAPFYGMVLDEWIEAIENITVPVHLFFGGADPFIPIDRIRQIESRFQQLNKPYALQIYPHADHGFFCHERSSYSPAASEDAWHKLIQFFSHHLQTLGS